MILVFSIDFSSKRAKLALRFFTYGVMTVSTVVISTVLVFFALGYRLDRNFNFTQGGLVQFRSFPEGAEVTVNGKKESFKTPGKVNLPAGRHTATMSLQGYRSWSKSFSVDAGQLIWLNYARFIPETVVTDTVQEFPSLTASLPSPDRRWLLLQMTANAPDFNLVDFSDEQKPKLTSFQLPEVALTKKDGKFGTFQLVEWDLKSQFALVKHQNGDVREFLRIDRSKPDEAINMTRIFGLNIMEAHFSGNNANVVFANTDGILRRLDIGSKSASGALVNDLKQFIVYGEESIAFTSTPAPTTGSRQQIIGVHRGDKLTTVRSLPLDKQVVFAYSEYDDHEYLAVATTDSSKVEVIRDPRTDGANDPSAVFAQFDLGKSAKWLSFSNNGRMLVAQNNNTFATYDLEEAKSYQFALDFGAEITSKLSWFDDFYLWSNVGGKLRIIEFDGKNDREITSVQPNFGVTLSSNGKRLFSVGKPAGNQFTLQSSKMTLQD
jgi:hypothetical protein